MAPRIPNSHQAQTPCASDSQQSDSMNSESAMSRHLSVDLEEHGWTSWGKDGVYSTEYEESGRWCAQRDQSDPVDNDMEPWETQFKYVDIVAVPYDDTDVKAIIKQRVPDILAFSELQDAIATDKANVSIVVRKRHSPELSVFAKEALYGSPSLVQWFDLIQGRCAAILCPGFVGMSEVLSFYIKESLTDQLDCIDYDEGKIFSLKCKIVGGKRGGQCWECSNIKKVIARMKKKFETKDVTPSKYTNKTVMTKTQLEKSYQMKMNEMSRHHQQEVSRLNHLFQRDESRSIDEALKMVTEALRSDNLSCDPEFLHLLLENAIKNGSKKKKKTQMRYSRSLWEYIISLYSLGRSNYERLRVLLPLPTSRAVQMKIGPNLGACSTLNEDAIKCLTRQLQSAWHGKGTQNELSGLRALVGLSLDEMQIERGIVRSNGITIGYLDGCQTQLVGDEMTFDSSVQLATHVTAVFVTSLTSSLRYPIMVCPSKGSISGNLLLKIFRDCISHLHSRGFRVAAVTSDCGDGERKLQHVLGVSSDTPYYDDPESGNRIHFLADPPHVLKRFRNLIYNDARIIRLPSGEVKWGLIRAVYDWNGRDGLKVCPGLVKKAVYHDRFSRMRVKWAVIVCSPMVTKAIIGLKNEHSKATAKYFEMCWAWFDIINARDAITMSNYVSKISELEHILEEYRQWMITPSIPDENKLQVELFSDLVMTIRSFISIVELIFEDDDADSTTKFFPRRLNQDVVESFFSQLRSGSNTSPTLVEVGNRYDRVVISSTVKQARKRNQNCDTEEWNTADLLEHHRSKEKRDPYRTPLGVLKSTDETPRRSRRLSHKLSRKTLQYATSKSESNDADAIEAKCPRFDVIKNKFNFVINFDVGNIELDSVHATGVFDAVCKRTKDSFSIEKNGGVSLHSEETTLTKMAELEKIEESREAVSQVVISDFNRLRRLVMSYGLGLKSYTFDQWFGVPRDITILTVDQLETVAKGLNVSINDESGKRLLKVTLQEKIQVALSTTDIPRPFLISNGKTMEDQLMGLFCQDAFIYRMFPKLREACRHLDYRVLFTVISRMVSMLLRTLAVQVRKVLHNSIEDLFHSESLSEDLVHTYTRNDLCHLYKYAGFLIYAAERALSQNHHFLECEKQRLKLLALDQLLHESERDRIVLKRNACDWPQGLVLPVGDCDIKITEEIESATADGVPLRWVSEIFFQFVLVADYCVTCILRFLFVLDHFDEELAITTVSAITSPYFEAVCTDGYNIDTDLKSKIRTFFVRRIATSHIREHHNNVLEREKGISRDQRTRAHKKKADGIDRRKEKESFVSLFETVTNAETITERKAALARLDAALFQVSQESRSKLEDALRAVGVDRLKRVLIGYLSDAKEIRQVLLMSTKKGLTEKYVSTLNASANGRLNGHSMTMDIDRVVDPVRLKDIFITAHETRDSYRTFRKRLPADVFRLDLCDIDATALQSLASGLGWEEFACGPIKVAQEMLLKSLSRYTRWDSKKVLWFDALSVVVGTGKRVEEKKRKRIEEQKETQDRRKRLKREARRV